jgi:ketosteroid isomerase-like protein
MSQENVEVVRRMWDAFLRRDFDEALATFDPDVEWDGTNLPDGTISRGHQAIVDHSARWFAMWDDWTIEIGEIVDVDDNVVVFIRERGRSKTGIEMDERHAEVYTLKDGRIVRRRGFSDPSQALDAARLGE